jgi:hypothetical protein
VLYPGSPLARSRQLVLPHALARGHPGFYCLRQSHFPWPFSTGPTKDLPLVPRLPRNFREAVLGRSILTGLAAFGFEWWRSARAGKAALAEQRNRAYSLLLARSGVIVHIADGFHSAMQFRSGLVEGVNVMLGKQKLLDPLELVERMRVDLEPLYEAWSEVWTVGSNECGYAARGSNAQIYAGNCWREVDTGTA